jgi:hypothetical protein
LDEHTVALCRRLVGGAVDHVHTRSTSIDDTAVSGLEESVSAQTMFVQTSDFPVNTSSTQGGVVPETHNMR